MKLQNIEAASTEDASDIFGAVQALVKQLKTIETFVARRFDEISMEINATAQQMDMAEDGIGRRFQDILEILGAISYKGEHATAANSGVELETVIEDTEHAANRILDAVDRIAGHIGASHEKEWADPVARQDLRRKIGDDLQDILMACTFQDLAGQRIRNTLNSLHDIEKRISGAFQKLGIEVKPDAKIIEERVGKASSQDDIDALFN